MQISEDTVQRYVNAKAKRFPHKPGLYLPGPYTPQLIVGAAVNAEEAW